MRKFYLLRHTIYFTGIMCLLLFPLLMNAQENKLPQSSELISQLIEAYNKFDYDKCRQLLNIAFQSIDRYPAEERKTIYQYAAFIAFENGNTTLAENHFWQALEIDPTFSPDPVTTSPKLLVLFQKTKIAFLQELNTRLQRVQLKAPRKAVAWRSILFPGWEQWHRGYKTRGAVLASAGIISLSGLVYSVYQTRHKKADYRNATSPDKITTYYETYNRSYQRQFYFGYALVASWLFSQLDLQIWSQPRTVVRAGLLKHDHSPLITLEWHF